ncbi:hypothetical protein WJX72_009649 [[Myrmecia] bisecta]|uniref:Uncharacterized protein n=1 Tax=[Myrmecia] bisecta TaxID=41462 RepID=A0AAW1QSA6_9CHLO
MASHGVNLYSSAQLQPDVLERRQKNQDELKMRINHILQHNPRRKLAWDEHRIQELDKFALQHGKRCIMWDDEGAGFYMMLNWDWESNKPAKLVPERSSEPGWYANAMQLLKLPLLDVSVTEDRLAAWIDANTMQVHQFLGLLGKLRRDDNGALVLDDPYWQQLQMAA